MYLCGIGMPPVADRDVLSAANTVMVVQTEAISVADRA